MEHTAVAVDVVVQVSTEQLHSCQRFSEKSLTPRWCVVGGGGGGGRQENAEKNISVVEKCSTLFFIRTPRVWAEAGCS